MHMQAVPWPKRASEHAPVDGFVQSQGYFWWLPDHKDIQLRE